MDSMCNRWKVGGDLLMEWFNALDTVSKIQICGIGVAAIVLIVGVVIVIKSLLEV